ncbi:hypothetical protein [Taibaiella helva]|uniref:hypothetical protein n=1 Tax=Taibaiella helva TaxID=2301235 RepID=UPI000E58A4EA|nr:hypothetical protein [Taibaiella helva]
MGQLFLLNEAIVAKDEQNFKEGMLRLMGINKYENHRFLKHNSIYEISVFDEFIYTKFNGQLEQEILRYIEQLTSYSEDYVDNESKANDYCHSTFNGFLGFDFSNSKININKQVDCELKYRDWCFRYSPDKEYLLTETLIHPNEKENHFADHHGKKELSEFWDIIKFCPFIRKGRSDRFGGKNFIRKIHDDGKIEVVLYKTSKQYAIMLETTGTNFQETQAIANIVERDYNR